jgi:predicted PurR-regulated permease PerM
MVWKREYNRSLIGGIIFILLVWLLLPIFVYIFLSSILASVGRPMMRLFAKIKIKGKPISSGIRAALVLVLMIGLITLLASVLVPSISNQAQSLSVINIDTVSARFDKDLGPLKAFLFEHSILKDDASIRQTIRSQLISLMKGVHINSVFSSILGLTGELFMGTFAILFMSFFFLKDEDLFPWIVILFISSRNHERVSNILEKVRKTLSKYFFGLLIEVSSMMVLLSVGGLIIGLENAILIGFIGGLLNVIPYLGPLIGASIGATLVMVSHIAFGLEHALLLSGEILIVFAVANMIDNFVLQPIIYSNSVNVHPMAIFIIIFVGGYLGGPIGMIVAIPIFTVLRIILGEFFPEDPFIRKITQGN